MRFLFLVLVALIVGIPTGLLQADSGPNAPYYVRSLHGFGPFQRGTLDSLLLDVGSTTKTPGKAVIKVTGDSAVPFETTVAFDSSVVVPIDIRQLQRSDNAAVSIEFLHTNGTKVTTAQRDLSFVWGNVGVRLDSVSSLSFEVGSPRRITILFSKPHLTLPIDSLVISLVSADTMQYTTLFRGVSIPESFSFDLPTDTTAALGTMVSVITSFNADDEPFFETLLPLPIEPQPLKIKTQRALIDLVTNNYGTHRSVHAVIVPEQLDTMTIEPLPPHTVRVVLSSELADGSVLPFDTVSATTGTQLPTVLNIPLRTTNLRVETVAIRASVFVRSLPTSFDILRNVTFDLNHPKVQEQAPNGSKGALTLRRWNPHNDNTSTMVPDTAHVITLQWPVSGIDSVLVMYVSATGQSLYNTTVHSNADKASCTFTMSVQTTPAGAVGISAVAYCPFLSTGAVRWDSAISVLPPYPALLFTSHNEQTSSGVEDVSDVLTIADLPPDVTAVRLKMVDAETNNVYLDTMATTPSVPYSGDVIFSSRATLPIPMLVGADTIRTVGFFVRSFQPAAFTLLRWQHAQDDLVASVMNDGTIRLSLGTDSLISSTVIRDGSWKHVGIVVRDTGIALFVDAALQGVIRTPLWSAGVSTASRIVIGDTLNTFDSLFAMAGLQGWKGQFGFRDLQRIRSQNGRQSGAVVSYPMNDAVIDAASVSVRDEVSGATASIEPASKNDADPFAYSMFYLRNIGMWHVSFGLTVLRSRGVNAIVTTERRGGTHVDTIPGLVQIQTAALTPNPSCATSGTVNSRLMSSEGWGPFNALEPVGTIITYYGGYTWGDVEASPAIRSGKDFDVTFALVTERDGSFIQDVVVKLKPSFVKSQNMSDEVVLQCPQPIRVDLINDSSFYISVLLAQSVRGINAECLEVDARISFSPPAPLTVSYTNVGPFRQSKIWQGDHKWNTFTAYTDDVVESSVNFVVRNDSGQVIHTIPAKRVGVGRWSAPIDMADCDPPLAIITAESFDGSAFKRQSRPQYFAITANRPSWLAQKENVRWSKAEQRNGKSYATARVCVGTYLESTVLPKIPFFGGLNILALPSVVTTRLGWDPVSNKLTLDADSSSITTLYGTSTTAVFALNLGATIANNGLAVAMSAYDIAKTVLEAQWQNIGSVNFNVQSASSSSIVLDRFENLNVLSQVSQTTELYWGMGKDVVAPILEKVLEQAEAVGEGPGSFFVELTFGPTFEASARFLVRNNIGTDSTGGWRPQGTFPVYMGDTTGPSLIGAGLSLGAGVSVSFQMLKGAAAITAYFTLDGDYARATAYTCDPMIPQIFYPYPQYAHLSSVGFSGQFLLQSSEVWGAIQQTLYGPVTFFKLDLSGDDLRDLYPRIGPPNGDAGGTKPMEAEQATERVPRAQYSLHALASAASPSPHTAQTRSKTYTTWIDQDHRTGVGTLNLGVRTHGHDEVESIIRVETNARSMVTPHVCALADSMALVVWKELDIERADVTPTTSRLYMYATSDIRWAVVNVLRGVVLSSGKIKSSDHTDTTLRALMVEGCPTATVVNDTMAMVAWIATDTVGAEAAIYATSLHGEDGMLVASATQVVDRSSMDHRTPHLTSLDDGRTLCTWISSDTSESIIAQRTFNGTTWSPTTTLDIPSFRVNHLDVDDHGRAAVVTGFQSNANDGYERAFVVQRGLNGLWDPATIIPLRAFDRQSIIQHPKISVRGDSAFVIMRSYAHTRGLVGVPVHRFPSAVVDLRTKSVGTGLWSPTDSLSMVHDLDIQWEPEGIHVIAQEHLPYAGLHANGTLKNPVGAPMMNLGMHTMRIADVITSVPKTQADGFATTSALTLAPSPTTSRVTLTAQQPFNTVTIMSLAGEIVSQPYVGDALASTTFSVDALAPGTYLLVAQAYTSAPVVTLLRVAPR